MADNFRIKIEDTVGSSAKKQKESSLDGAQQSGRPLDTSGQSTQSAGTRSKDEGSTSISIKSDASKFALDHTTSGYDTKVTTDLYSEEPVDGYSFYDIEAQDAIISAVWGEAYGKIVNGEVATDAAALDLSDLGVYARTADPARMDALVKKMTYGAIKEVVSALENGAGSSTNPGSNNGGNAGGSDDGYRSTDNGTNGGSTNPKINNISLNIPISELGEGVNPYENVLPGIDALVSEIRGVENEEEDYSDTNDDVGVGDGSINRGDNSYGAVRSAGGLETSGVGKWDLRAVPDAMSNMYDVYFRVVDDSTGFDGVHLGTGTGLDDLFASRLLSARIGSIEIPAYERGTTSVTAWGNTIERPTDNINTPGQSSFTIRGDTRLIYVDFFNTLSGTPMSDMLGLGSALISKDDKLSFLQTRTFLSDAKKKVEAAREKLAEETDEIKEFSQKAMDKINNDAVAEYTAQKKKGEEGAKFSKDIADYAAKNNVSVMEAGLKFMEDDREKRKAELIKAAKKQKEESLSKADGYWAAAAEERKIDRGLKAELKKIEDEEKELQKKQKDIAKDAAKTLKAAKKNRNKAVMDAYFRNPVCNQYDEKAEEMVNYITTAVVKNMAAHIHTNDNFTIEDFAKAKRVDIIVKRTSPNKRFTSKLSPKKDERFIFEDVKFLGSSTPIKFNRESADTIDFSYNFIYKRFYKLDYYTDNAQDWINSQLDALSNDISNAVGQQLNKALGVVGAMI